MVYSGNTTVGGATLVESLSWQDLVIGTTPTGTGGTTTVTSVPLSVSIDTTTPNAPVETGGSIVAGTTQVLLTGTAEANSTVIVLDGTVQVGTATANSSGVWSLTTANLATGSHSFTAKATDVAGNTGSPSAVLVVSVPTAPNAPSAPAIATFSTDSGVAGDHITNDNTLTLTGTAVVNSTVKVFDGATQVGMATADSGGAWSLTTSALLDGNHNFTATATNASGTSAASMTLAVTIDTVAPNAPVETGDSILSGNQVQVTGTAEANSLVQVYDGAAVVGTATTNASGIWTVTTSALSTGAHNLTGTATDAAGNTSALSLPLDPVIGATVPAVSVMSMSENSSRMVTIKGTGDAYSQIKLYDGTISLSTVAAAADGTWSFTSSSPLSNTVHTFTAQELDSTGHAVASSGRAILGSTGNNTLKSTTGNDLFVGNGGQDTFVFAPNFGKDVITDFLAGGGNHDVIQFSKSVFNNFASVLAHATQVGQDVVISADATDSLTLKNTKLSALNSHDFHFA